MTLNFMTKYPDRKRVVGGEPTFFVEKIQVGLILERIIQYNDLHLYAIPTKLDRVYKKDRYKPKIHTIRSGDRWKAGTKIHFKIWSGKPYKSKTYNFAPIIPCMSVQDIEIQTGTCDTDHGPGFWHKVIIDGRELKIKELEELAINDGFECLRDFCAYFDEPFKGQIIHWTEKIY